MGLDSILTLMLDSGADIDGFSYERTIHGHVRSTPLQRAIRGRQPTTVTLLLSRGADVTLELDCHVEGEWVTLKAYELALALGFASVVKAFLEF